MVHIKTKEGASLWIALLATAIVAVGMVIPAYANGGSRSARRSGSFVVVALAALFIIRKYVAYKLKPIYSIVLSRDVHTNEIFSELKDKRVENIGEELTAWADTNDREIARLKEAECFRKQYLGNVAHELKTPIFNIQGYISTLLDGGLEDELINRKYLERAEKSIDRLINIVNDLDTISKLESSMNKLNLERFDVVALAKEIAEQAEMEADRKEHPDFGQGDRQPAFALLGAGRQTLHRAGVRQPDHQLDPLRQGGRRRRASASATCWTKF